MILISGKFVNGSEEKENSQRKTWVFATEAKGVMSKRKYTLCLEVYTIQKDRKLAHLLITMI